MALSTSVEGSKAWSGMRIDQRNSTSRKCLAKPRLVASLFIHIMQTYITSQATDDYIKEVLEQWSLCPFTSAGVFFVEKEELTPYI